MTEHDDYIYLLLDVYVMCFKLGYFDDISPTYISIKRSEFENGRNYTEWKERMREF